MIIRKSITIVTCFLLLFNAELHAQSPVKKGLKDYYKAYFPIGVAVSPRNLTDSAQQQMILEQFNSLTPENAMKMRPIHPQETTYNWRDADAIVNFAQAHHMRVRGHNLCWYKETPDWIIHDKDGKLVSKEVLLSRLKEHIYTVVNRYKGKIYAWDVVNEAVADGGDEPLRNSVWYQICGEDYIFKAFQYAHEADPKAVLFYNEYGTESPVKRERVYQLLKRMLDAGIPVDAVGLQAHWSVNNPSQEALIASIKRFSSLGLKIQITEMDVSVYTNPYGDITDADFTPEREQKQADLYAMAFKVFREYKQYISGVTFWNVSDKASWLDNFPIRGRKNYPLLFDQNLRPKKAYQGVINF
ncbi:endo-1,4-beta-xylanase [Mucilaginibacter panaciglaebae]|uniref:Beta-xylanase n=1 Tax=Mucilaginibacter panaciglaebae TaxID=502331 RepID=A0ABP7WWU1_9SPHI